MWIGPRHVMRGPKNSGFCQYCAIFPEICSTMYLPLKILQVLGMEEKLLMCLVCGHFNVQIA